MRKIPPGSIKNKIGICTLLNRCTVTLARPPVILFSAYALASSQIEFRLRINNLVNFCCLMAESSRQPPSFRQARVGDGGVYLSEIEPAWCRTPPSVLAAHPSQLANLGSGQSTQDLMCTLCSIPAVHLRELH
jgi:hypothetical protein